MSIQKLQSGRIPYELYQLLLQLVCPVLSMARVGKVPLSSLRFKTESLSFHSEEILILLV